MNETDIKDSTKGIILNQELDIDLNDLFTIDFKNLKLFLTTILNNQNEMKNKLEELARDTFDNNLKNDQNYSLLNRKLKIIENNFFENKKDIIKEEIKREEEKFNAQKERPEYVQSNINMEIITSKPKKITNNESGNKNIIISNQTDISIDYQEKNIDKENEKGNENEDKDELKDNDKDNEIKSKINNRNSIKNKISDKRKSIIKEKKEEDKIIREEDSVNSENEGENEVLEKDKLEDDKNKSYNYKDRRYEDPYGNIPIKKNNDNIQEMFVKYDAELEQIKNKINNLERRAKLSERGSKLLAFKTDDNNQEEDIKYLKLEIKDLQNKNAEIDKEKELLKKDLEELKVKMKDLDILEIISDTKMDQGNVDLAKALVMTLEQKVFKKTGLIDDKIKHLYESMHKLENEQKTVKNIAELLKFSYEDAKRMIKNIEEMENKNTEDTLTLSNDVNDIKNDVKKLKDFETKANDSLKNITNIMNKLQNNISTIGKKVKEMEENLSDIELQKSSFDKEHFLKFKNEVNEAIKDLKRKNLDIEKQIELLKNRPDLIKAKEDIIKLEKEILVKVDKTDYLDLKDKFNMQETNITNINDTIDKIQEITNKTKNEISFLLKKLESLNSAQISTRTALNDLIKKQQELLFDSNKYLESSTFNKFITSLQKEKENTENNFASINRLFNDMAEKLKSKSDAGDMKIFEQLINNKLEELKLYSIRKLADKAETNRNIKYLDSQIRHIIDVYIKKAEKSESWLIAKKPLGGYSCASCESYLGELKNMREFTPWSKYPNRDDKNYRYGSGFSRMLNMLNVDFKNQLDSIKDNAYESDNERRNSAEPKSTQKRFSKNLSAVNINNTNINSRNVNTNETNREVFPKIALNKNQENNNGYLSMDIIDNGNNLKNSDANGINSDNEKINMEKEQNQPHVIKIYRKNKFKNFEINKKIEQ